MRKRVRYTELMEEFPKNGGEQGVIRWDAEGLQASRFAEPTTCLARQGPVGEDKW